MIHLDGKPDFNIIGWVYKMIAKQGPGPVDPFKGETEINRIRNEYREKTGKMPPGINYDEFPKMEDYKRYLIDFVEKEYEKMRKEGKDV